MESPWLHAYWQERVLSEFGAGWRAGIEQLHQLVMTQFAEPLSTEMLKQVLAQLLLYYTRMQDLVRKEWAGQRDTLGSKIVPTATMLQEIRKYSAATS